MATFLLVILVTIISTANTEVINCDRKADCECGDNNACTINCDGKDYCKDSGVQLICKSGQPCTINCLGESACGDAQLYANGATSLEVVCNGKDACKGISGVIQCPSGGDCSVTCIDPENGSVCQDTDVQTNGARSFQCSGGYCPGSIPNNYSPAPTPAPTNNPTTPYPSKSPTRSPTPAPTNNPIPAPTNNPTPAPTNNPSPAPTNNPTKTPTKIPTRTPEPTGYPTSITTSPTPAPTNNPTPSPTNNPIPAPTENPTPSPTENPTPSPTENPTPTPTENPTPSPTEYPTPSPTTQPTPSPTINPTPSPTKMPTKAPTTTPTRSPLNAGETHSPSSYPTPSPTNMPTKSPTNIPSSTPSKSPSDSPTKKPTPSPVLQTRNLPSPSNIPTSTPVMDVTESGETEELSSTGENKFLGKDLLFGIFGTLFVCLCICFIGFFMRRKRKQKQYSNTNEKISLDHIRSVSGMELGEYKIEGVDSSSVPGSPIAIGYIEEGTQGTRPTYDNAMNAITMIDQVFADSETVDNNHHNSHIVQPEVNVSTKGAIIKEDSYSEDSTKGKNILVTPYSNSGYNVEEKQNMKPDQNYKMAASMAKYDEEVIGDDNEEIITPDGVFDMGDDDVDNISNHEYIDVDQLVESHQQTAGALRDDEFKSNINNNVLNEQNVMDDIFKDMSSKHTKDDDKQQPQMNHMNRNNPNIGQHQIQIAHMNNSYNYDEDIDDISNNADIIEDNIDVDDIINSENVTMGGDMNVNKGSEDDYELSEHHKTIEGGNDKDDDVFDDDMLDYMGTPQ